MLRLTVSLLLCLPVPLLAQIEIPKRLAATALGEVRSKSGPWVGAQVFLVEMGGKFGDRPKPIQVQTDERGRFRAAVIAGRKYHVWARSPVEAGEYRCTGLKRDVRAAAPVLLKELDKPRKLLKLRLQGLDPWQKLGKLQPSVSDGVLWRELELDENGGVQLPPAASTWSSVYGTAKRDDGTFACIDRTFLSKHKQTDDKGHRLVKVAAPKSVRMSVWSWNDKKAVGDAVVYGGY